MTAKDHNRLLGIFFLINGGISALGGLIAALIYGGMGAAMLSASQKSEQQMMGGIFLGIGVGVAIIILIFSGFYLFTGWKIYKEQPAGRILGIIGSILCMLSFPLGTALGVYGLWFLFGDLGKSFYEGGEMIAGSPPPPPNSWQ